MATKSGKMMTYLVRLLPINSDNSLIKFSFMTMWQTETIISLLPQCIWPPILQDGGITWGVHSHKVAWLLNYVILLYHVINHDQQIWQGGVTHNGELRPLQSHDPSVTCSCEVTWHLHKLCLLLHLINTWYNGDLLWGASNSHDHLNKSACEDMSQITYNILLPAEKVVTYHNRLQTLKSHNPLIMWFICSHVTTRKKS